MRDILFRLQKPELELLRDAILNQQLRHPFKAISVAGIFGEQASASIAKSLNDTAARLGPEKIGTFVELLYEDSCKRISDKAYELVWTGPEGQDVFNRDTRVVVQQLFDQVRESLFIIGFAFYNGKELFKDLAQKYDKDENLKITMCLNVHRKDRDTSSNEMVTRKFRDEFFRYNWPGKRIPPIYFDPRSLEIESTRKAQLHAKCIIIDKATSFVGSANFTDKAHLKNIEAGVLVHDPVFSTELARHFEGLIEAKHLEKLGV